MSRSKKQVSHFMSPPRKMMPFDPEAKANDDFEGDEYANLKFECLSHHFIGAHDDLRDLIHKELLRGERNNTSSQRISGMAFPMNCNQFDTYQLQRAVPFNQRDKFIDGLLLRYDHVVSNSATVAFDAFQTESLAFPLASLSSAMEEKMNNIMEKFASDRLKSVDAVAAMSRWELASLACWLSWSPDTAQKLLSKNGWIDGVVGGLLAVLSSRTHEPQCLSLAVSCVAFLVEAHATAGGVLTDANISQLLKLLLSKAVYPTASSSDISLANDPGSQKAILASQQWELTFCRTGLLRLLKIPRVLASEAAVDELFAFIKKWWDRLKSAVSGGTSGFETPGRVKKGTLSVLRCALEVINDIHATVPQMREFLRHTILDTRGSDPKPLSFMLRYIASSEPHTALAASALVASMLDDLIQCGSADRKQQTSSSLPHEEIQAVYACAIERIHYYSSVLDNEGREPSSTENAGRSGGVDENVNISPGDNNTGVGKKRTSRSSDGGSSRTHSASSSSSSARAPLVDKTNNRSDGSNKDEVSDVTVNKSASGTVEDSLEELDVVRATVEPLLISYANLMCACLSYANQALKSAQLASPYTEPHMQLLFVRLIDQMRHVHESPVGSTFVPFQNAVVATRQALRTLFKEGENGISTISTNILADDNIDPFEALEKFRRQLLGVQSPPSKATVSAAGNKEKNSADGDDGQNSSSSSSGTTFQEDTSASVDDVEGDTAGSLSTTLNLVRFSDRDEADKNVEETKEKSANCSNKIMNDGENRAGGSNHHDLQSQEDAQEGRRSLGMIFTPAHSKSRYINDVDLGNAESQYPIPKQLAQFDADISGIGASQSPRYLACSQISQNGEDNEISSSLLSPNILPSTAADRREQSRVHFADSGDRDAGQGGGFNEESTSDALMECDDIGYGVPRGCILEFTPVDSVPPYAPAVCSLPPVAAEEEKEEALVSQLRSSGEDADATTESVKAPGNSKQNRVDRKTRRKTSNDSQSKSVSENSSIVVDGGHAVDGAPASAIADGTSDAGSPHEHQQQSPMDMDDVEEEGDHDRNSSCSRTSLGSLAGGEGDDHAAVDAVDRSSQSINLPNAAIHPTPAGRGSLPPICDLYENPLHSQERLGLSAKKNKAAVAKRATTAAEDNMKKRKENMPATTAALDDIADSVAAESPLVATLLARLRAAEIELQSARTECEELRAARDEALVQIDEQHDALEQAQVTIGSTEAKLNHHTAENSKLRAQIQLLQKENGSTALALKESEERRCSQEKLLQEAWDKLAAMAKLEVATKLERDAALASAQKSEAELLQLQDAFATKEGSEVELVSKLTHTQEQLRKNKEEAAQQKAELLHTQEELQASKTEVASLTSQLQVLTIGLQGESARLQETSEILEETTEELERNRQQLEEARDNNEELKERVRELEGTVDELQDSEEELKQNLADSEAKTESLRAELRKHRDLISMINQLSASADHASRDKARRLSMEAAAQLEEASSQCDDDDNSATSIAVGATSSRRRSAANDDSKATTKKASRSNKATGRDPK